MTMQSGQRSPPRGLQKRPTQNVVSGRPRKGRPKRTAEPTLESDRGATTHTQRNLRIVLLRLEKPAETVYAGTGGGKCAKAQGGCCSIAEYIEAASGGGNPLFPDTSGLTMSSSKRGLTGAAGVVVLPAEALLHREENK